jgi:hypothetical protein
MKVEKLNYPMSAEQNYTFGANDRRINRADICGARTRKGTPCRRYDLYAGGRCRLHGGLSLSGQQHGRYRTGMFTKEMIQLRKEFRDILRQAKKAFL